MTDRDEAEDGRGPAVNVARKFRKKPVVIEAMQYTGPNINEIADFVGNTTHCDCGHILGSGLLIPPDVSDLRTHFAAVVLAHLEAQGWARGVPKYGVEFQSPLGDWVEPFPSRAVAERMVALDPQRRLMRRFEAAPTAWEPVETGEKE